MSIITQKTLDEYSNDINHHFINLNDYAHSLKATPREDVEEVLRAFEKVRLALDEVEDLVQEAYGY